MSIVRQGVRILVLFLPVQLPVANLQFPVAALQLPTTTRVGIDGSSQGVGDSTDLLSLLSR